MYNDNWINQLGNMIWRSQRREIKVSVTFLDLTIHYEIEPNVEESPGLEYIRRLIDKMKEEDDGEEKV